MRQELYNVHFLGEVLQRPLPSEGRSGKEEEAEEVSNSGQAWIACPLFF